MKKQILITATLLLTTFVQASAQEKFNPEKMKAEMHSYITAEAKFSKEEATAFFPLYDAMKEKQRSLFKQKRELHKQNPTTDAACRNAILKDDQLQREMQTIESSYHQKMLKVVSPTKVYKALAADRRFHHNAFKKAMKK